jgi:Beige/BEACH domain
MPEILVRNQNQFFTAHEKIFTSIEKSWSSGIKTQGDYKELCPEFYCSSSFLINLKEAQAVGDETLCDVELPSWAENPEHFIETMREALESDYVSQNLHHWIDFIFGYKQKGGNNANIFPDTCYGVNWATLKVNLEKEAYEIICKEFGQCPEQLFFVPHPCRVFRFDPQAFPAPDMENQVSMLEKYLNTLQNTHQQKINSMLDQYNKSKEKILNAHNKKADYLKAKICDLSEHIRQVTEEIDQAERNRSKDHEQILNLQPSREVIRPRKTPSVPSKQGDTYVKEVPKKGIEHIVKSRKIQSKTPTKPH